LLARFVLTHRLSPADPLSPEEADWEQPATVALLAAKPLNMTSAAPLLA